VFPSRVIIRGSTKREAFMKRATISAERELGAELHLGYFPSTCTRECGVVVVVGGWRGDDVRVGAAVFYTIYCGSCLGLLASVVALEETWRFTLWNKTIWQSNYVGQGRIQDFEKGGIVQIIGRGRCPATLLWRKTKKNPQRIRHCRPNRFVLWRKKSLGLDMDCNKQDFMDAKFFIP